MFGFAVLFIFGYRTRNLSIKQFGNYEGLKFLIFNVSLFIIVAEQFAMRLVI